MTIRANKQRSSLPALVLVTGVLLPMSAMAYGPRNTLPDEAMAQTNIESVCEFSPVASGPRSAHAVNCRATTAEFAATERQERLPAAFEWADYGPRARMVRKAD